jgi:hypothetical protein
MPLRQHRKSWWKGCQEPRSGLDQDDARGFGVDVAKIAGKGHPRELSQSPGELDPRGSPADDDEMRRRIAVASSIVLSGDVTSAQSSCPK